MKKKIAMLIMAAFICTGVSAVYAGEAKSISRAHQKDSSFIELTGDRKIQMLDAQAEFMEKMIRLRADLDIYQSREDRIMLGEDINFKELKALASEASATREKIALSRIDALAAIKNILTQDQWNQYLDIMDEAFMDSVDFGFENDCDNVDSQALLEEESFNKNHGHGDDMGEVAVGVDFSGTDLMDFEEFSPFFFGHR